MARNYKNYEIYKCGYQLVIDLYKPTESYPAHEQNNLISQIRRAATSIPVNIAEGSAKRSSKEFQNYLNIAYGSSKELAVLIDLSKDIGYIKRKEYKRVARQIDNFNKKIFLFIRHLEKETGSSFFQKYSKKKLRENVKK